jgi:hypothetical protein
MRINLIFSFTVYEFTKKSGVFYSGVHSAFINKVILQRLHLENMQPLHTARVAQSVQCLTTDWTAGVQSPTEAEDFSSSLCFQTGSGAHPAYYTIGTGGSFPRGKTWPGCDADHSPPSNAKVKKE